MTENPAGQDLTLIHAKAISLELDWLKATIERAIAALEHIGYSFENQDEYPPAPQLPPESWYARFVAEHQLDTDERLVLILALAPEIDPGLLDQLLTKGGTRLGGAPGARHRGFLPTIQTALFLLAAGDIRRNIDARRIFDQAGRLLNLNIIIPGSVAPGDPHTSMIISVRPGVASYLCSGSQRPMVMEDFPAHRLKRSHLNWDELVLPPRLFAELDIIRDWLKHCRELRAKFRYSRPGFKALFYGPSGAGKTLTATLLGREMGLPVYRLDLGRIITKDLAVTEKNLDSLLNQAERQNGILFFDETDIMLGKSGDNRRSSDSYLTQGIASLLTRLEDYDGLVILADSVEDNLNRVMNFRFSARLYFPQPDAMGRVRLWRNILGDLFQLPEDFGLSELAEYSLNGGEIVNIVQYLTLVAIKNNDFHLTREAIVKAVERQIVDSAHGVTG